MKSSKSILKDLIKESRSEISCPICNGTLLNHNEIIAYSHTTLQSILNDSMKKNINILKEIPAISEIIELLGEDATLSTDVSLLDIRKQVVLKILEIKYAFLSRFTIVLKNLGPYENEVINLLEDISYNNKLILLDWDGILKTKNDLIECLFTKKVKPESYCYEILGYKKISTLINKIKKKNPCPYCNGKAVLREESIFEGVDVTETPCTACKMTGINEIGLNQLVEGLPIKIWLSGNLSELNSQIPDSLRYIPLFKRIRDLNKRQLKGIIEFLGG